ncbi:MAG: ABC transporter substrate-binding protein [Spartobacteria bacterium]|jgi:NitT/TauT family transport system substrate-binding protein|nr:ABC transporter substrate-binding protein [Spartobacteria bacterium]
MKRRMPKIPIDTKETRIPDEYRKLYIVCALVVAWALAFSGSARAHGALVLHIGMFPNITHAQALVAANMTREGKGWFESKLGRPVKIEWLIYNAGSSAMEGIFTKAIDMTFVGPSPAVNAYARSNGKDIRVMSGALRGGEALVVKGDEIQRPSDFRGKTIATPQLGNTQDVECRAWLIDNGIRVTLVGGDARVLPTANPDMLPLFKQGQLQAAWTVEPWVTRLINEAGGRIFHSDPDALTTVLVGSGEFLTKNAQLAADFKKAHEELTAWILANPSEARRRARDELTAITKREISQALVDEAWTRLTFNCDITVTPFEKFLAQAKQVGFLRAKINLQDLIWKP